MWAFLASVVVLAFVQVDTKAVVQRITRGKEDSFALKASSGCPCDAFNGSRRFTSNPDECLCRCPLDAPTFYTKEGEAAGRCLDNIGVFLDAAEICRYHFVSEGIWRLVVIDLHDGNKSELWPRLGCQNLEVQRWQYRHNGTWKDAEVSSNQIFSSSIIQRKPFLQWEGTTDEQYQGLLIKANLSCSFGSGGTENGCIMFKTNGTQTMITMKSPTTKAATVTIKQEGPTVVWPTGGKKVPLVIGLATAGAVILIVVIILVALCISLQKRNTREARTRDVQNDIASPAHDYECIEYPAVTGPLAPPASTGYEHLNPATRASPAYDYAEYPTFPADFFVPGCNAAVDNAEPGYLEPVDSRNTGLGEDLPPRTVSGSRGLTEAHSDDQGSVACETSQEFGYLELIA